MEDELEEGQADLESRTLEVEKTRLDREARLGKIESDREMAELELSMKRDFQKTDTDLYSRSEIIESQIDETLARHRRDHALDQKGIQTSLSEAELELLRIEQRKARQRVDNAQEGLVALEIRAPHSGVVTWIPDWSGEIPQVGSQIWPGMPLAELPDLSRVQAEVFVLEADAGGLAVGKPAEIVLEARPEVIYRAKVKRVSSVPETPFRGSPVQYFGVTLEFEEQPVGGAKPGQRVRGTLLLGEQPQALVIPRQAVQEGPDGPRVLVREGERWQPRNVVLGGSSLGLVVIQEGLAEGEVIALERPAGEATEGSTPAGKSPETSPEDRTPALATAVAGSSP
jgi:RND family efflux transporter MFP subunit